MYRGSTRILLPAFFVVFAGILLGLLIASPDGTAALATGEAEPPRTLLLPWAPMLRAPDEMGEMRSALTGVTRANLRERLATLQAIYEDDRRPEVQRGLAAFSAPGGLSENHRGPAAGGLFP